MSKGYGFSALEVHVLAGFEHSLGEGAWARIKTDTIETGDQTVAKLLELPRPVQWKLQLKWSLGGLITALAQGNAFDALDQSWDRPQRRLDAQVTVHEHDDDPAVRAAAGRVRKALLRGGGTGQTQYGLADEVSFGRTQLRLAREKELGADIKLLKLGPALDSIGAATEALAKALGIPEGAKRPPSQAERVRAAAAECVQSFNDVARGMDWHLAHLPEGPAREQVSALRATLERLLDQAPAARPAPAASENAAPTEPAPEPA